MSLLDQRANRLLYSAVGAVKRDVFKCERCGHEWISHKYRPENPPVACAKCKSPYWNVIRRK